MGKGITGDASAQGHEFPDVVIYTGNHCVWCVRAKEYMAGHGVAYTEKNVEEDEAFAIEALALVGQRGVPIIVVGSQVVRGFNKPALDTLLGFDVSDVPGDGIEVA